MHGLRKMSWMQGLDAFLLYKQSPACQHQPMCVMRSTSASVSLSCSNSCITTVFLCSSQRTVWTRAPQHLQSFGLEMNLFAVEGSIVSQKAWRHLFPYSYMFLSSLSFHFQLRQSNNVLWGRKIHGFSHKRPLSSWNLVFLLI